MNVREWYVVMVCSVIRYGTLYSYGMLVLHERKRLWRKNDGEGSRASGIDLIGSYKISFLTSLSKGCWRYNLAEMSIWIYGHHKMTFCLDKGITIISWIFFQIMFVIYTVKCGRTVSYYMRTFETFIGMKSPDLMYVQVELYHWSSIQMCRDYCGERQTSGRG